MTLNDILVSALAQLDRGHDAQSLDIWRDKLTGFANDAVLDLASACRPRKTEATAAEGGFRISALSRPCIKVYRVRQAAGSCPFIRRIPTGWRCPGSPGRWRLPIASPRKPSPCPRMCPSCPATCTG